MNIQALQEAIRERDEARAAVARLQAECDSLARERDTIAQRSVLNECCICGGGTDGVHVYCATCDHGRDESTEAHRHDPDTCQECHAILGLVTRIRCLEHRDIPAYNTKECGGGECCACEILGQHGEAIALLRRWWKRFPASDNWDAVGMALDRDTRAFLSSLDARTKDGGK